MLETSMVIYFSPRKTSLASQERKASNEGQLGVVGLQIEGQLGSSCPQGALADFVGPE